MPLVHRRASISRPSGHWAEDDYDIVSGGLVIGKVMKTGVAGNVTVWRWYLHAIHAPVTGEVRLSGHETNLEQAKAAVAENWRKWLALARLNEIE